jgi:hypothetical protein
MTRHSKTTRDHEAIRQDDAVWFKAHPDRNYRLRRAHDVELRETERPAEASASYTPYTVVGQVYPGHRVRMHCWSAYEMIDSEELAYDLFDQFVGRVMYVRAPLPAPTRPLTLRLTRDGGDQA